MTLREILFGKKKTLESYPVKSAKHFGMTFNDWRKLKGFKLEKGSVPSGDLFDYCRDCGWPDKYEWQTINALPDSGPYLDSYQYNLWLNFIGVVNPDRSPEESKKVIEYIKGLKTKSTG